MATQQAASKDDSEISKRERRLALRSLNAGPGDAPNKSLDSSFKRHEALRARMRRSLAADNRDSIMKDLDSLTLERYAEELVEPVTEGVLKCKTDRDVWSAVEVISALHRRLPDDKFTKPLLASFHATLAPPPRGPFVTNVPSDQKEKEDMARISRQRPVLRVCAELAMVGVWQGDGGKGGTENMGKILKDLLAHDPTLSSLPLLITFLKSFSRPYLGITAASPKASLASLDHMDGDPTPAEARARGERANQEEQDELVERDVRDRMRKMIDNYFETVCKKLVQAHLKLQEQDRRNHEAYIKSGEIFEDRQQAYEKMTKNYEKLLSSCQSLSELLHLPVPDLPSALSKSESVILTGDQTSSHHHGEGGEEWNITSKWEDEEERRFYEDLIDLKDWVPKSFLGIEEDKRDKAHANGEVNGRDDKTEEEEAKRLEEEMMKLDEKEETAEGDDDEEDANRTPTGSITPTRSPSPVNAGLVSSVTASNESQPPAGPAALMTALLARLPDAINRELIDQAAIDFAFLNSKAARKRLIKFMGQIPKNRNDLLPYYSRFIATLNKYMPDIGEGVVALLEDEFRYLQKKKKVIREMEGMRIRNMSFLSALTKHRVVPPHLILHIFKVFLDDFTGTNVDNVAMLLEGCGRFLLRSAETGRKMAEMLDVMKRKQSLQRFDERQQLMLENAYYHCNPPERAPRQIKERPPMEMFIRHLIYDVLSKKTVDKVLKLIRKLHWEDPEVVQCLMKAFTKVWNIRYGSINLLAVLACDLQRYHPEFAIALVDQILEDVRRGLEANIFKWNQRRIASVKYLAELYNYRLIGSGLVFDTLWLLVTFGHPEGRPLPSQPTPIDAPDDFFRVRLICTILDACGMCFDKGAVAQRLDVYLAFFQMYVLCKQPAPMDVEFMITDTIEALRPKMTLYKTYDEAAHAVDELFALQAQKLESSTATGDDSDGETDERANFDEGAEDDDDAEHPVDESEMHDRPESPDEEVLVHNTSEPVGPSPEEEANFVKELAKMISDSGENRKVDRKTAMAMWDSTVIPGSIRRRKEDSVAAALASNKAAERPDSMKFTLLTKKGNRPQAYDLNVPASSDLATQTLQAQIQDKEEQQHLKRLVLNYEQREEEDETKNLESSFRNQGFRVNYGR